MRTIRTVDRVLYGAVDTKEPVRTHPGYGKEKKTCAECEIIFRKSLSESASTWVKRKYCSKHCSAQAIGRKRKKK